MTRKMDHGQNMNQIILQRIEDTIWKPRQQGSSNSRKDFRVQKRIFYKTFELQFKKQLKFSTQPAPLFFIPTERLADFANCASRKFQAVGHVLFFS